MPTDWNAFADEIDVGVLQELGSRISIEVPTVVGKNSTGKKLVTYKTYTGIAVRGKYDSSYLTGPNPPVQAGDVKFICQFDDKTFEPLDNKDMTIIYGSLKYKIENVDIVAPAASPVIIYILQGRRVN